MLAAVSTWPEAVVEVAGFAFLALVVWVIGN